MASTREELLEKANALPLCPGVYIMRDRADRVIYVGKSAKLKQRVSGYFQNGEKNTKTAKMVASVARFDYILCDTEMEALSLENSLIKQYTPRYNIRLKDAKSYPYIKVTDEEYPRFIFTRRRLADKARYFGPFTGTATVFTLLSLLQKTLGIPACDRRFPRDFGRERPCLYYQMKQCCGLCTGKVSAEEYGEIVACAVDILRGNTRRAASALEEKMTAYAEAEQYEAAARCRDTLRALEKIHEKQKMVASPDAEHDVAALYRDERGSCLSIFRIREGVLAGKNEYVFGADKILDEDALTAFLTDYYRGSDDIPATLALDASVGADEELLSSFLSSLAGRKRTVYTPKRGEIRKLCELVYNNAKEKAEAACREAEKDNRILLRLSELLALETLPERIEAYDISNFGEEHKTAGMVVYEDGKPKKSDYRIFTIEGVEGNDDYACMREALARRVAHLGDGSGAFAVYPDLILLDGGRGHVSTVKALFAERGVDIPVFGMVKDDYHKTRALCTENEEIGIAHETAVYGLIYRIQEEVHRYTVSRMEAAKSRTLRHSSLEKIPGIGAAKAKLLLSAFGGVSNVRRATEDEIAAVRGISKKDAAAVTAYFRGKEDKRT